MIKYVIDSFGPIALGKGDRARKVFFRYRRAVRELEASGIDVNDETLARTIGTSVSATRHVVPLLTRRTVELDSMLPGGATRSEVVAADAPTQEDILVDKDFDQFCKTTVLKALTHLTAKERTVADNLLSGKKISAKVIAAQMGITTQRLYQIEKVVLGKLSRLCSKPERIRAVALKPPTPPPTTPTPAQEAQARRRHQRRSLARRRAAAARAGYRLD